MLALCDTLDTAIDKIGRAAAYLIVMIAVLQIAVSLLRYFFSVGSILLQEMIFNLNVVLVSLSICYGVLRNIHTRVDVFKERQSDSVTLTVEFVCVALFMLPTAAFLTWALTPYVLQSWGSAEGSRNVGGMGGIYIIKSFILTMAAFLTLQSLSLVIRIVMERRWPYPRGADGPVDG